MFFSILEKSTVQANIINERELELFYASQKLNNVNCLKNGEI